MLTQSILSHGHTVLSVATPKYEFILLPVVLPGELQAITYMPIRSVTPAAVLCLY